MDNRAIAQLLRETADLMEIAADDPFRVRSYRRAADSLDTCPDQVATMASEPKTILAIPGIGKGMLANIQEVLATGRLGLREQLLEQYRPGMLDLLQVQGLGPKTIALIWDAFHVASLDEVEALGQAGKLRDLPRLGAKAEEKILRGIAAFRSFSGRFRVDQAQQIAAGLIAHLRALPEVVRIAAAGSVRRGRETVGDVDILIAGPLGADSRQRVSAHFLAYPGLGTVLAQGDNKVSAQLHRGPQVDLRLLPAESWGAALQYFTGSKQHNVTLRQRAQRQGLTLNEYGLFREADMHRVAGAEEAEIYSALGLPWIAPELREDSGEFEAAEAGSLPRLLEEAAIRGDVHMHTVATDGRSTIVEMAEAAEARGYGYIAITDHSQALAMANGLNEERALVHLERIRSTDAQFRERSGFRIFTGIEVDILADGRLDLDDEVLAQMDVVIGSVHSRFDQSPAAMTDRLLRAIANPNLRILGHPTGRLLLRREPFAFDAGAIFAACKANGVALEINAAPERLDLNDVHARLCRQRGIPIVINTDAHHTRHLDLMRYGVQVARRAWLEAGDVLNTLPADEFLARLRK